MPPEAINLFASSYTYTTRKWKKERHFERGSERARETEGGREGNKGEDKIE